jgi:hypothetical protein
MTQPEALRLAEELEVRSFLGTTASDAAAELRRLHAVNQELRQALRLAALALAHATETVPGVYDDYYNRVSAAIAKAEGQQ